jgi:division protein CdvB (Snf7/Vps24/ESCRT-III family)
MTPYSLHVNNVIIRFFKAYVVEETKYMSARFSKRWDEREAQTPISTRIKEAVRPPGPLKPRLDFAIRRIELQVQRLDQASDRFTERDKSIFARIVEAYTKHDMPRANVFANELAEIRKMEQMIMHARLALEQIVLRLKTVSELGDVVSTLAPAVGVLRTVRTGMSSIFPEAERELGSIGNLLSGIIIDAGQSSGLTINFETANDDAQKILTEAASVAEQKIKDKFPDLPAGIPTLGDTTTVASETQT